MNMSNFVIMIACLLCVVTLIACVLYVLKIKAAVRIKYNELMLEKTKLAERANALSNLEEKYNNLLKEYNHSL